MATTAAETAGRAADVTGSATQSPKSELTRGRVRAAWLFLTPMLILLLMVAGWPLLRTIWFSFTDANLSDLGSAQFVGFENYLAYSDGEWYGVLADGEWWNAVWNTLKFSVISVALETVLGLIVALVLNASFPGRSLVRAAVLIPWAIPTIVSAKMWGWMMHDQFGILNHMLMGIGLISAPLAWTASPDLAMTAVIMVDVWKTTPFMALLILAALQMLPTDCYEAARVDGIHPVRVFFRVTLPLIQPALMVAVIFRLLDALRIFDLIYVLTSNSKDTMSMSVYARQQLVDFQSVGYGSAASTLLFFTVALCVVLYITFGRVRFDGGR
ncbi:MAG TPA: sugar ABC transporter permease [Xanthomonadaceae bacterium]|nr:sugar ABC transporter permease [Xanthomonadaceae bacterium]